MACTSGTKEREKIKRRMRELSVLDSSFFACKEGKMKVKSEKKPFGETRIKKRQFVESCVFQSYNTIRKKYVF